MFVIEAQRDSHRWVSGVFRSKSDAESFLTRVPDDLRGFQSIREIPFTSYPLFMIELGGFDFMSRDDAIASVRSIERVADDEHHVYFNLYIFSRDCSPRMPGTDYMGSIKHFHIDNCTLDELEDPNDETFTQIFPVSTVG